MKKEYWLTNFIDNEDNFVLVSNYLGFNEVCNLGFISLETLKRLKSKADIGFWRVKRK